MAVTSLDVIIEDGIPLTRGRVLRSSEERLRMEPLHIYRFPCEHATLSIQDCPGRWCVLVRMEGQLDGFEDYSITLTAAQWSRVCAFDPFSALDSPGPLRAVTFSDKPYGDVLELSETRDHHTVQLRMWPKLATDPDECL